jgi:hypothetical protein
MKPENKNIVNQLVKEATKLPNDDYFTDLSAQLLRQINTPKAPVIPIYKKLFFVVASSAAVSVIAISTFWKSTTNTHSPKQLISQKTTVKTPVIPPAKTQENRIKVPKSESNQLKTNDKTSIPYETIAPTTDDALSFESLEKEAIYAYLLESYSEIDEEQLAPLVTQ